MLGNQSEHFQRLPNAETVTWMRYDGGFGPSLTLSRRLVEQIDFSDWQFFAFTNGNLESSVLLEFSTGKSIFTEFADACLKDWMTRRMSGTGRFVIAEDWRAKPGSRFLKSKNMPARFFNDEVYYFLSLQEVNDLQFPNLIFPNTCPAYHAYVLEGDKNTRTDADSAEFATRISPRSVIGTIFGAYDGESYVVGERPGSVQSNTSTSDR